MGIDNFASVFMYEKLQNTDSMYACFDCNCSWVNSFSCFICDQPGELLIVPIKSEDSLHLPSSYGIKLSPQHVAVHPQLIDALKNTRYNNEQ